jgi:DnaJ-class molecular chaperone
MTVEEARKILGLGLKATRREIKGAYRREARRWHPDRAPAGGEAEYRARMQQINEAYQRLVQLIDGYRYELVDTETPEDLQQWWTSRFFTGVWSPPKKPGDDQE